MLKVPLEIIVRFYDTFVSFRGIAYFDKFMSKRNVYFLVMNISPSNNFPKDAVSRKLSHIIRYQA